ncbi:MAG: bifunctional (p)ppGpp synthetase/guanosine-3',5'-bis(diphosphate) 3'-pyrophosphohydrolase [Anaerolineae bacterium]|nr:bifunctional (p)ppGpp synthetase/guanosine-3',5'-bis(diphosphate) 3'-pyrophosphohydrolase [Anaerolineae bacterium]
MKVPTNIKINDILDQIPDGITSIEARDLVRRAYQFAEEAHDGQLRKSGEPYIHHPLYVAYLLAEMHFEPAVIAAGFLHDVLEDCSVTHEQLQKSFGKEIAILVEGVTKLEAVEELAKMDGERVRDLQELESIRKLLIVMAEDDVRVIFIKLADRLHNMRTLDSLPTANQQRMARETLEIFAPLANRLGIWVWKAELEDLAFRYLNPTMYKELAQLLESRKDERQERVAKHVKILNATLARENVPAKIYGRPKHIYSIYHKMRRKHVPFARIYDAEGVRVIVETKGQCYQVLGIVHQLWKPVPGEFDDYIAHPKPNGYQSLHTAVVCDDGASMEIQIRTGDMDHVAEYGVAAHWRYKERGVSVDTETMAHITAIRQSVHDLKQEAHDAQDFIASIRVDVFQERVYVFTPKGKVIDLPFGATPLDFAYYVHTEVGHRCRGARVNGRWITLDYPLHTGDQVEIILGRQGGPSRDWINLELGFVKTTRAQQKIKQWFRRQSKEENIARGRNVVDKVLKRLGLDLSMDEVLELFKKSYKQLDEFLAAVGVGDVGSETVVSRLERYINETLHEEDEEVPQIEAPPPPSTESITEGISIRGTGGVLTHIAKCCRPLPGDDIVGYVTRGRGVTVHRCDCQNILQMGPEDNDRLIEVEWGETVSTFPVQVVIQAYDRSGLIHDVTGIFANRGINMSAVSTGKRDRYNVLPVYVTLEITSLAALTHTLAKIEQLPNVIEARRIG